MVALRFERMICPDDDQLALHVDGALSPTERAEVAAHLLECGSCRSLVAALAAARTRSRHSALSTVFPVSTWRWEPGRRVGRHVLQGPLGRGGMGEVYEAVDTELHRTVAIKVARAAQLSERVVAEGRTLARLDHPNVVRVFDAGTHDGAAYIVLERAPGSSLRRWLAARPRSVTTVLELFRGVARGCAAIHAIGLVHRDIKPDNILVGHDGQGMLSDFGLAAPTRPGSSGTPGYIAPEVERGEEATPASDQYGFCVTLDEALQACSRGSVPRWARAVIQRGRRPNPGDRFASMDAVLEALTPPSSTTRVVTLALASLAIATVVLRPEGPEESCGWVDAPWPANDDPAWGQLEARWKDAAVQACERDDGARACLEQQRRDAAVLLDAATEARAYDQPWAGLEPAACLGPDSRDDAANAASERIAAAAAARIAGDHEAARTLAAQGARLAQATGRPGLIAAALTETGKGAAIEGQFDLAAEHFESAHWMAMRTGELGVASDSAIELVDILTNAGRYDEAIRWHNSAAAALDRLETEDWRRRAELEVVASLMHQRLHDFESAVASAKRAGELANRLDPMPESLGITVDTRIGGAMQVAGDTDGALEHLHRALDRQLKLRGEQHRTTGVIVYSLGILYSANLDELERAVEYFERAIAIADDPDGPPSLMAAEAHEALAHSLVHLNRHDEAQAPADRADALYSAIFPEDHIRRLTLYPLRANLAQAAGRLDEALRLAEEGILAANHTLGGNDPSTAALTAMGGEIAYNQGEYALALERFTTALEVIEMYAGPDHPLLAEGYIRMGDAEVGLEHREKAFAYYERAMTGPMVGDARARALLGLARTAPDPDQAADYAQQAREENPELEADVAALLNRRSG